MSLPALWFVLGLLLMLAELAIPGFVIFFFGIGAMSAALFAWISPNSPLVLQGLCFIIFSVLSLVIGRRCFRKTLSGKTVEAGADADDDGIIEAVADVTETIEPPRTGRVALHGTEWSAIADHPIAKGTAVTVVARDNITLKVK